jgi:hypothetical protein
MSTAGPDAFPGETLDNVLSRIAATTRAETNAGMAAIEWTDDEIKLAVGRHAAAENDLFHSFLFLVPSILTQRGTPSSSTGATSGNCTTRDKHGQGLTAGPMECPVAR